MNVRGILEHVQSVLPTAREGVVVLAYHLVGAGTDSPVDVPVDGFREQMKVLSEMFTVLPLARALEPEGSRNPVAVVTFDDAFANFRQVAWPILADLGLPATLYVPTDFIDGRAGSPIRGTALGPCTWEDLRALRAEGLEIGSHSVTHRNLTSLPEGAVLRELEESKSILEDRLGGAITSFCYPRAKWNHRVLRLTRAHFRTAVIAGGRRVHPSKLDAARIPRFPIRRDLKNFERLVQSQVWFPEAAADWVRQWIR